MNLKETGMLMNSKDFKDRFRAEYFQLDNRIQGLTSMLDKYSRGTLNFTPKCGIKLLDNQLRVMIDYKNHLIERAKIEDINLEEVVEHTDNHEVIDSNETIIKDGEFEPEDGQEIE